MRKMLLCLVALAVFLFMLGAVAGASEESAAIFGAGVPPGAATAAKFIDFVASPPGQQISKDYGKKRYGEGPYDDAAYARKYAP